MSRRFRYNPRTDAVEEVGRVAARIGTWKDLHAGFSLGVEPEEVPAAQRLDAALGAPYTDYDAEGAPVFKSRQQYDQYLKAHGYVNRTSGRGNQNLTAAELARAAALVQRQAPSGEPE